jgi:hypothetical protein
MQKNQFVGALGKKAHSITPRWLTYDQAAIYSGLGTRVLENHVRYGFIRSSHACAPGATRGRRLICRESLDAFIEAGVNRPPLELAMNSKQKKPF